VGFSSGRREESSGAGLNRRGPEGRSEAGLDRRGCGMLCCRWLKNGYGGWMMNARAV
jgi:hypothetical protein